MTKKSGQINSEQSFTLRNIFGILILLIVLWSSFLTSCRISTSPSSPAAIVSLPSFTPSTSTLSPVPVETYTYSIVHVYPHDTDAFTEGLVFNQGSLFESTGLKGQSSLRQVDLDSGRIIREYNLPGHYFGEGITIYNDTIIQLTYQSHIGFVYDLNNFMFLRDFSYPTEGWGLTQDGHHLIMSDGTSNLTFLDPQTFKITGSLPISDNGVSVDKINALAYINGEVYANIWLTDKIAIINLLSGKVDGWIDLTGLLQTQKYSGKVDVLNGIAYDSQADRIFVTGKWWPYLFQIKLVNR
jgi:glutaminyl-peptide cyclotransferase